MSTSNERATLEAQVIKKALQDSEFRANLIADPKGTLEKEFNVTLPADLSINVYPEGKATINLVLPYTEGSGTQLPSDVSGAADCSGWSSFAECTLECTQCGNNDTSCQPGPTGEE